jgi:hypothetical protein
MRRTPIAEHAPMPRLCRHESDGVSLKEAIDRFLAARPDRAYFHLVELWKNWPAVMGEELSSLARPLGARERVLLIGAEDSLTMHDLSFRVQNLLERANSFLREPYFNQVRLELLQGRESMLEAVEKRTPWPGRGGSI